MKRGKFFAKTLVASLLLLSVLGLTAIAQAQSQATVTILDSLGGTTNPGPGTYTYSDGATVTITASASNDQSGANVFQYWVVTTDQGSNLVSNKPLTFTATGGTTYNVQAAFQPIIPITAGTNLTTAAIVVVLGAIGGTTNPAPGTYALANATVLDLTATPNNGWQFDHWVISGNTTEHGGSPYTATPTDNPYNVNHGYGYTFSYQPVFSPTSTSSPGPSPTVPETSTVAVIAALAVVTTVVVGTITLKRRK